MYQHLTIQEAFDEIRSKKIGNRIVYFYVIDDSNCLVGVIPTRRLFTSSVDKYLSEVMIKDVITISLQATVLDVNELLARHKFLALPVVDEQRHIIGVVDVSMFLEKELDFAKKELIEEVFETIGLRVSQIRDASPFKAFRYRFSWLIATLISGIACALLASVYEVTLTKSLVLAFFLTLILGLGESVSMQSMTVTIHNLRVIRPTYVWYIREFIREISTSFLLGLACAIVVSLIVWIWHGTGLVVISMGSSIILVICSASFFGLSIPVLLHTLKLDPKIAAGPMTLAITDICTLLLYFSLANILL